MQWSCRVVGLLLSRNLFFCLFLLFLNPSKLKPYYNRFDEALPLKRKNLWASKNKAKILPKVTFMASAGQFWWKKLTSIARTGKLIIDQQNFSDFGFSIPILGVWKTWSVIWKTIFRYGGILHHMCFIFATHFANSATTERLNLQLCDLLVHRRVHARPERALLRNAMFFVLSNLQAIGRLGL